MSGAMNVGRTRDVSERGLCEYAFSAREEEMWKLKNETNNYEHGMPPRG
jgi:hypothetical protein